jgi:predicted GNAT superfamily acetyltransferase
VSTQNTHIVIDPTDSNVILRDITDISELRKVEQLQKDVWGIADLEVFPALAMIPMLEVGGVLIGAFDGEVMAGFVFGFPGQEHGKAILHSDMLAVRPEYRRHGLGAKLKLAQRRRALAIGIDTITWTFDPLQARNARLNFGNLGVTSKRYCPNYYGETTSFLHQNGTDRLWVTWELESDRVRRRIADAGSTSTTDPNVSTALLITENKEPFEANAQPDSAASIAIEIPADINTLLSQDHRLALRWREATRKVFTALIDSGHYVAEFDFVTGSYGQVGRYILDRRDR